MLKKTLAIMLASALLLMTGCGKSSDQKAQTNAAKPGQKYTIKLCYENNAGDPIDQGAHKWAELVKERTKGNVEIQIYPSSQLGKKADLIEMMLLGQNVATIADGSYLMDYVHDFGIVMGPYIIDNWDQMYKLTGSDWWKEQEKALEKEKLKIVTKNWIYGDRHLMTKKPVTSLNDLKGMKIRVPNNDISVNMFKLLGAAPTPMALAEVYTSLSEGVVDGVENPLTTLYTNNFQEVCKNLTFTGHQMTFSTFIVGTQFFNTMPKEYQEIVMKAGDEAAEYNNKVYKEQSKDLEGKMKAAGVQMHQLKDLPAFKEAVKGLYKQYEDQGKWSKGLYDKIQTIIK